MALSKQQARKVMVLDVLHSIIAGKPRGQAVDWKEIVKQVGEKFPIKNWLTEVRGPLQFGINAGHFKRTDSVMVEQYFDPRVVEKAPVPLRLGSATGSLINHIYSGDRDSEPVVGMGATILMWSDRHAATVVEVSADKKRVVIQRDNAKRTDKNGMSESQTYEFTPDPEARRETYTLRKNGAWVIKGGGLKNGGRIKLGARSEYRDFSF